MVNDKFFGIYTKQGVLEAVEISEDSANEVAFNLATVGNKRPFAHGRIIKPVVVFPGTIEDVAVFLSKVPFGPMVEVTKHRLNQEREAAQEKRGANFLKTKREAEAKRVTEL